MSAPSPGSPLIAAPGSRRLRWSQAAAVFRLELATLLRGRAAVGIAVLAAFPVLLMLLWAAGKAFHRAPLGDATLVYAAVYRGFLVAMILFFGCVAVFTGLVRREVRGRTLHYYLLTPVRRDLLIAGKYAAGVAATFLFFGASTVLSFALIYVPFLDQDPVGLRRLFLEGPGFAHLAAYLLVTFLACVGYGAVFLTFGLVFKNPVLPALLVYGWEWANFLLPPALKQISIIHYLGALTPVPVSEGPLAILAAPASPWLAAPGLLVVALALLAVSAWRVRRMEILYGED